MGDNTKYPKGQESKFADNNPLPTPNVKESRNTGKNAAGTDLLKKTEQSSNNGKVSNT